MVVLLDTHVLVWTWTGDKRLGKSARDMLSTDGVRVKVSIVSVWELAIKHSVGKLDLAVELEELIGSLSEFGFGFLPMSLEHAIAVRDLPLHHRDPFDRMLIAQARHEGMHLLTADPRFSAYDVPLVNV